MTTQTAPPVIDSPPTERYEHVLLGAISASKTNPRKHFDEHYIDELSRSIAEKGVIQPIVLRPIAKGFEIVAGECRFRASKRANRESIPAIVRTLTDEQVLELQLIENLHRRDLTPLEQARGYRALIDANPTKHSAESIANRVGMSPQWVWDRMKLMDLVPEAQELLRQEYMSVGHAILIARLKHEDQARVIDPGYESGLNMGGLWHEEEADLLDDDNLAPGTKKTKRGKFDGLKAATIRELEKWINDHIRFDVKHMAQAVPMQFEELAEKVTVAEAAPGRGKKVIAITFDNFVQPEAKSDEERTFGPKSFKRADGTKKTQLTSTYPYRLIDSPACDFSVLGVVAAGDRRGEAFDVCIARDKCEVHWKKEIAEKAKRDKSKGAGKPRAAEARRQAEERRERAEAAKREARDARWKVFKPALEKACKTAVSKLPAKLPRALFERMLTAQRLPRDTKPAQLAIALLQDSIARTFDRAWEHDEPQMVAWAKLLKVDVKACEPKPVQTSGVDGQKAAAKKGGKK
jgi:ParB family chromosome partitioning protein